MVVDFGEAWGCSNVIVRRILGWIGHRLGRRISWLILWPVHIQIQVVNTFAGIRNLEQEQVVSLVQFPPTRSIVSLNSTGLYRHAANVIVFPYCEWWASRYQLAPCQSQVDSKLG